MDRINTILFIYFTERKLNGKYWKRMQNIFLNTITKSINISSTISEPASDSLRKVNAVRPVISSGKCEDSIVVSIVHQ